MSGPVLVTGAAGFAGSHLVEQLLGEGATVAAWSNPARPQWDEANSDPRIRWTAVDLLDRGAVAAALEDLKPSALFHCAGAAHVAESFSHPERALRVNVLGTHHLLRGIHEARLSCRVLVTGSAMIYRPTETAIGEDAPIGPTSPYAVSKLAQEMLALRETGVPVIVVRPFNHAGPRQAPTYVTSSFAQQIAEIEAGRRDPVLHVGNLDARRDLTDVRDTVRAYRLLMNVAKPAAPYNVCSGIAYRVGDLLDTLLRFSRTPIAVKVDPERLRPSDNPIIVGDCSRLARETGWHPSIPIERTLEDLLNHWRARTRALRSE